MFCVLDLRLCGAGRSTRASAGGTGPLALDCAHLCRAGPAGLASCRMCLSSCRTASQVQDGRGQLCVIPRVHRIHVGRWFGLVGAGCSHRPQTEPAEKHHLANRDPSPRICWHVGALSLSLSAMCCTLREARGMHNKTRCESAMTGTKHIVLRHVGNCSKWDRIAQ